MTTTKRDLARMVVEDLGVTQMVAYKAASCLFDSMRKALINGERIEIRGFGALEVKETRAREARNPRTNAKVFIPARRKVWFKPGKEIRNELKKPARE